MDSILLHPFATPFRVPPFDQIKVDDFEPAILEAIDRASAEIDNIANNPEPPTFENTIAALENSGEDLGRVLGVFFPLLSALCDRRMMDISEKIMPRLTEYSTNVKLNADLWKRIKAVRDEADIEAFEPIDRKLLEKTYDSFVMNGALLEGDAKLRMKELAQELSRLTTKFEHNVLNELNGIEIELNADEIDGLPDHVVADAEKSAKQKGLPAGRYLFNLQQPTYVAVMKFATDRSVRERFYRAYAGRNIGGDYDNTAILVDIARIRASMARLLGFDNFASYVLQHRMAKTPREVDSMLHQLLDAYKGAGEREIDDLTNFAATEGADFKIMQWDYSYWSNKLREHRYDYDEQRLRPYFELSRVIKGVFGLATRLYGVEFVERHDLPVYHPDVKVFEVTDNGTSLGILYTDFFPRDTKQSGAWMTEFKDQWFEADGGNSRPVVSIVMNFTKPTDDAPSLLTPSEVRTFLHEFGHALHGLFSQVKYASLSGTSVYRDFVELPSQFNENFLTQSEFLDSFASHYLTGEKLPTKEIDKIVESAQFGAAYACLRQLCFGFLDMAWHTLDPDAPMPTDVEAFEAGAVKKSSLLPIVERSMISPQFSHIFAGGYAAGYYSYKWAEVLDADAFAQFLHSGNPFNKELAARFRHEILERGGSEHPAELYRRFRGGEPTVDALLQRDGINPQK